MGNLYSALVRSQQTSILLEWATGQFDSELCKAEETKKNYADQGKLIISLTNAQEKAGEKIKVLESANQVLTSRVVELEAFFAQAQRMMAQRTVELEKAWAKLVRIEGERASQEAAFEDSKDVFANFSYYYVFADAIWGHLYADPSGDISAMVKELACMSQTILWAHPIH